MADTAQQAEVKTKYPVTSGLTAGSTKQDGRVSNLVAEGLTDEHGKLRKSNVRDAFQEGL